MKPHSPLVGWHVGRCTSTAAGLTANLILSIHGVTATTLHGELVLLGDLGGGGMFQGLRDHDQVTFTTEGLDEQVTIAWEGTIADSELSGTYVVRCGQVDVAPAMRHQEGIWSCRLAKSFGSPNPDEAHDVWVYHDGNEEGPFTTEAFIERLNGGQWPANALVALNDRTVWSTTAGCLEKLQAEATAARN